MIDLELQRGAEPDFAALHRTDMDEEIAELLLRVGDAELDAALTREHAGVPDLAAGLRIERRLVEHDRARLAGLEAGDFVAVLDQRGYHAFGALGLVAQEFGRTQLLAQREPDCLGSRLARALPGLARRHLLALHRIRERRLVDADAARLQRVLRQVEREAVGVVEREGDVAVEHIALLQARALLVEDGKAPRQRLAEAGLFQPQRFLDQLFRAHQLGIGLAHLADQRPDQPVHQRLLGAKQLRMAHGAAHDPAQHVAAALVRRQHAVGDEEGRGAQMVGDDAERGHGLLARPGAERGRRRIDQVLEQVGLEHALDALEDAGHPLQAHAGVDRGTRQRLALLLRHLLELHEHEIPEFEEAVAVLLGRARRPAPDVLAAVDEDLRARTTRAGVAHRPEIVRGRDTDDAVVGEAGDLLPKARRLVVGVIDRDEQLVLLQSELGGDQLPGELDRALLEIVAEREIAEHLEEGEMARGVADIVEVVVLAAGAHAFLRGGGALIGPLLHAGEDVLELHHAGIGEHQRRVVARHQWRGRHDLVAVLGKEVQKGRPDLVDAAHVHPIGCAGTRFLPSKPEVRADICGSKRF
ncbi:hypothetical protein ACVIHA_002023 [Bradyrhizobium liaoningense]